MNKKEPKIILIGAGIMSATLGVLIKKLIPRANISIYERLDEVAAESSDAWNNAGTGHSAFCELNYTPQLEDGSVDITMALKICESFEVSKQLWAHLKESDDIPYQTPFINDIDHMSFVWGSENVEFLRERHASMTRYAMFADMVYSEDPVSISTWVPLMMRGREITEPLAATRMAIGTDVNFGSLTREMIAYLQKSEQVQVHLGHEVEDISRLKTGGWKIEIKDRRHKKDLEQICDYVFIGAGGGSLLLLDKADIPEARGYGGFPVSGQFLRCNNPEVIKKHEAKVYGKAAVGSPPMSVPHLDTRMLDGVRSLLFGPYAGFSTKFLKNGSYLDLPLSIEMHNVWPMLSAGIQNIALTKYLIKQVRQKPADRFKALQAYYPDANAEDWELAIAGQRVQIIKKEKGGGGVLKFGTEIVCSSDKTLAALLGASPGASTSVTIMLEVLQQMFPSILSSPSSLAQLRKMIPTYGQSLVSDGDLCLKTRERTTRILKLED